MGFAEFVGMVAALMALNALAVDIMLPALQQIGFALNVVQANSSQAVLSSYLLGFGIGQLLVGSISDRFGRRPVLLAGLAVYVVAAALCSAAPSFELLIAGRILQGMGSAAPRVITISIVRDCYSGRRMASVMSLAMMVFMAVPILAPSIGQVVILLAPWRAIFGLLTIYGIGAGLWIWLRLPETLPAAKRRSLAPAELLRLMREIVGNRQSVGYALAGGTMFGAMFGFLVSAQQVFTDFFRLGPYFPIAFASVALAMSMSSFLNSRLVVRFGMRRLSHAAVTVYVVLAAIGATLTRLDLLTVAPFLILLGGMMFLLGMIFSNFNSLAMEPQGRAAGTASSLFGSITTLMATAIGSAIGAAYDGTPVPLTTGFLVFGAATLLIVAIAEKGRLYR